VIDGVTDRVNDGGPQPYGAPQPLLRTARLLLRPYQQRDALNVQRLAGDRRVAATTATIPHPYPDGAAEVWMANHPAQWASATHASFAVTHADDGRLVGGAGLVIDREQARAEIGYWIAVPEWGHGYATEAAEACCQLGFAWLGLRRIEARYLATNTASGRVMAKLGMQQEGTLRSHVLKWGEVHDLVLCGVLAGEWRARAHVVIRTA
jgi:RimJ/RimL family protein N-acetyltransferase